MGYSCRSGRADLARSGWVGCGPVAEPVSIQETAEAVGTAQAADPGEIKRLGEQLALLAFRLDNGEELELATPGDSSSVALGPFYRPGPKSNESDSGNRN